MPVYTFRDAESDEKIEAFLLWDEYDKLEWSDGETVLDGRRVKRDYRADWGTHKAVPGNWPIYSDAFGCHPDQVQESMQEAAKRGVPTEYTPDGRAVFRDRAHRKKVLSAFGFRDNDAGYGD